jgi:hydroxymethylpyrimidine/phosphomethylpyrimidine kinase
MLESTIISTGLAIERLASTALTIAGSDPSGGAGLQADLKTFQQMGVYGMSVVTLLTVQNTLGVSRVEMVDAALIAAQIDAVLSDISPKVIKIGALGTSETVRLVADKLQSSKMPIVIDPVMVSKHGNSLVADDFLDCFKSRLLPLATVVTPNRFEAEKLVGFPIVSCQDAHRAAQYLSTEFNCGALVKLGRQGDDFVNFLGLDAKVHEIRSSFQAGNNTHGSGCVLAALIAGELALGQTDLLSVVTKAVELISAVLCISHGLGQGIHPLETRLLQTSDRNNPNC